MLSSFYRKFLFFALTLIVSLNAWGVLGFSEQDLRGTFKKQIITKKVIVTEQHRGSYKIITIEDPEPPEGEEDNEPRFRQVAVLKDDMTVRFSVYPLTEAFKDPAIIQFGKMYAMEWYRIGGTTSTSFYMVQEERSGQLVGMLLSENPKDYFVSFQLYAETESIPKEVLEMIERRNAIMDEIKNDSNEP